MIELFRQNSLRILTVNNFSQKSSIIDIGLGTKDAPDSK